MGEDKPKNALDEFWDQLGDKAKKYVRSYRHNKRNSPPAKNDAGSNGKFNSNSSSRRG